MSTQTNRWQLSAVACLLAMSALYFAVSWTDLLGARTTPAAGHAWSAQAPRVAVGERSRRRFADEAARLPDSAQDPAARATHASHTRLAEVTNALAGAFERDSRHAEHLACKQRGGDCGDLFTDLAYAGFYGGVFQRLDDDGFGFGELIAEHGSAAVHAALADVIASSEDALQRTAALAVLERVDALGAHDLPLDAYRGLSSLSTVEQQLLLGRHAARPITDPELAEEVSALGVLSTDERVIGAALGALAHAKTDRELAALVARVPLDAGTRLELERVVGRCADACPETLASLLQRSEPDAAQALHAAVRWTDDSRVDELQDTVRRLSQGRVVLSAN